MSTYILLESLRGLGCDVDMMIPNRITDGYGINEHLIEQAWQEGRDTIITCDNGIAAVTQIRKAKDLGMTVIVTDHHEVPFEDLEGERKEILTCRCHSQSKTEGLFLSFCRTLRCSSCNESDGSVI